MDRKDILNYIMYTKIARVSDIIEGFNITITKLNSIVDSYNNLSYYNKIEIDNGLVSVIDSPQINMFKSTQTRIGELELLWQTGLFNISELEIIFGRSRKTIYKDIQKIKLSLQKSHNESKASELIQIQFNKYSFEKLEQISEYKNITLSEVLDSIADTIVNCLKMDIEYKDIVERNLHFTDHETYANESKIFAGEIINSVQTYLKVRLINPKTIEQIQTHIYSSYYKYVTNTYIRKIDLENVKPQNQERFDKVSTILEMVFKSKQLYYSKEELLYLSLYFLNPSDFAYVKIKIVDNIGSGKLLIEKQLKENFENFKIVDSDQDYTISTSKQTCDICISTKFDVNDYKRLSQIIKLKSSRAKETKLYYKLLPLLKTSVSLEQFSELYNQEVQHTKKSLEECLLDDGIIFANPTDSKESTIDLVANILEKRGSVSSGFKQALLQQMELYSTEFNLINNVALVHAPIANYIYKTDLVLIYSRKGFAFANSQVNLIIGFSALDDVELLLPLQDLYNLLSDNQFSSCLANKPNNDLFLSTLHQSLKRVK